MKRVLMIAFHFPPLAFGSGIQRTLSFVRHLPALGWQPAVLTVDARAHGDIDWNTAQAVPPSVPVTRAFTLDAKHDLSIRGHYLDWTARPDRWASWHVDGVRQGLRMVKQWKPDVMWSTYPIPTAHRIAETLHAKSGIPWIADFRDPMLQSDYPKEPALRRSFGRIERSALGAARFSVFTTPGTVRSYRASYPDVAERIVLLENGYEEDRFASLPDRGMPGSSRSEAPLLMLHSGVVYPEERDPEQLFIALSRLQRGGTLTPQQLRIRFRASHHGELLRSLAQLHGVSDWLDIAPAIAHREALAEMMQADALLIMQATNCNAQIPAKLYEYLRAGRPIGALTDPAGDTAAALIEAGVTEIAPLDSAAAIEAWLPAFVSKVRMNAVHPPEPAAVTAASRGERAKLLAGLLERAVNA